METKEQVRDMQLKAFRILSACEEMGVKLDISDNEEIQITTPNSRPCLSLEIELYDEKGTPTELYQELVFILLDKEASWQFYNIEAVCKIFYILESEAWRRIHSERVRHFALYDDDIDDVVYFLFYDDLENLADDDGMPCEIEDYSTSPRLWEKYLKYKREQYIKETRAHYRDYLKSKYWKALRLKCFKRDGFQCQICGSGKNLCAHHMTYKNIGYETQELDDLITLCEDCHKTIHKQDLTRRKIKWHQED